MKRVLVAALALVAAAEALAQAAFPARPVTLIVGFAPGGGTDIAARIVAKQLAADLGHQVLVENRAGSRGQHRDRRGRARRRRTAT